MKSDHFFRGDQYFSPAKNSYKLFFLMYINQITETLKKNQINYIVIWLSDMGREGQLKKENLRPLISQNWSVTGVVKKKTSMLKLTLTNQLT